ncbi:MAG: YkgJ family cysteine cluster protein, partial [Halobacteriota archaeon]
GSLDVNDERAADGRERALAAHSWAGEAIETWAAETKSPGSDATEGPTGEAVELSRGAPETEGW